MARTPERKEDYKSSLSNLNALAMIVSEDPRMTDEERQKLARLLQEAHGMLMIVNSRIMSNKISAGRRPERPAEM